jgi:hypothetical protein
MLKRLLPIVIFLAVALTAAFFLLRKQDKEDNSWQNPAITLVPEDAVLIIESRSVPELLKTLIQSDPLFSSLQQLANIRPHLQAFRKIDSLITRNARFKGLYGQCPAVVSLHQTGKNQYQFLLILENQETSGTAGISDFFTELCGHPGQWSQRVYNGQQINRITFGVEALLPGISMAGNKKYLVISPSPVLLENAVRQMNLGNGLFNSPALSKLSRTNGKSAVAHVYINLKILPTWFSGWMNPAVKRKMEMFTRYGDWASLDLSIRNDAIWLNGFALEGDTLNSYINLFKSQVPPKLEAEKYLPSTTAVYFTLGVDKPAQYLKGLSDYLAGGESGRKRQRIIDNAAASTHENVVKVWADLGFKELTIGYLCGVADETVSTVVLVGIKNGNQAADKMVTAPIRTQKKICRVDDQHEYEIFPMPFDGLPEILGGSFFSSVSGKFFAFLGNFMVLSDDIQTLEEVLHKYSLNKTLANDAVYQSLTGLITTRSNVTFFAIPYKAKALLLGILNPKSIAEYFANDQFLLKTGAIGLQFQSSNQMSLHNIFASFAGIDYSKPQTIWESKLEAKVFSRPVIVTNHITQDKEIIVQDEASNLYLINSSGRILWKKNIGEHINSEIFQVDVMKNGRLQYMFSTPAAIHLLDRNGNYLPKYPVQLKLPSTNGMSLIDFDGNRDYRIFIACSDNKVYGYDKNGNPLKGWNFGPASGPVTQPVQCFKIQNKDYLVFNDPVKIFILDRKGSVKVNPKKDFAISPNNRVIYEGLASGKGSRFLITDVDGTVYSILLDGTVESGKIGGFGPEHYFNVEDVNKDGLGEFVFIDRDKLDIFNQSGEKLGSRKLDGNTDGPPCFYIVTGNVRKIGLTIASKNEILLINGDGSLFNGFPLDGQTLFTVGNLEKASTFQNLLVGSDEAYLYNYAIK